MPFGCSRLPQCAMTHQSPALPSIQGDLLDVELLPGKSSRGGGVTVLRMRKPRDFNYRPGMYMFVNVPSISVMVGGPFKGSVSTLTPTPAGSSIFSALPSWSAPSPAATRLAVHSSGGWTMLSNPTIKCKAATDEFNVRECFPLKH